MAELLDDSRDCDAVMQLVSSNVASNGVGCVYESGSESVNESNSVMSVPSAYSDSTPSHVSTDTSNINSINGIYKSMSEMMREIILRLTLLEKKVNTLETNMSVMQVDTHRRLMQLHAFVAARTSTP